MGKIKKFFKKLKIRYRKRKLYKLAEMDASIMCGAHFRMLPPEVYIEGDKETMLRETQRVLREFKQSCGELDVEEDPTAEESAELSE